MAYPHDLSNVAVFKIHPAIGVARVANNPTGNEDYYYEYFAQNKLPREDRKYMSDVDGVPTMRRQAVQFKVFAYDSDLQELGELDAAALEYLGLRTIWSARLGNRKIYNYGERAGEPQNEITAEGSADSEELVELFGKNPYNGDDFVLASLNGNGLLIPGMGGIMRKTPESVIPSFPANQYDSLETSDTTFDGLIEVTIEGTEIPVIPASVIGASQEHSPDVNVEELLAAETLSPSNVTRSNKIWRKVMSQNDMLSIQYPAPTPSGEGQKMDEMMIATMNGDFFPGIECCFDYNLDRAEFSTQTELNNLFYNRGGNFIGEYEIRPRFDDGHAIPGQLSSGLCSTWQGDLVACLSYWTAEYPTYVHSQPDPPGKEKPLFRAKCDSDFGPSTPDEINEIADHMGVSRNNSDNPEVVNFNETERNCTT